MWILRWLFGALLIILILGFSLQNQNQTVSIQLLNWKSPVLPLYLYLYFAFGAGMIFWVLISAFNIFKLRGQMHQVEKENRRLKKELDRLRNVDIEDDLETAAPAQETPPEIEA